MWVKVLASECGFLGCFKVSMGSGVVGLGSVSTPKKHKRHFALLSSVSHLRFLGYGCMYV